MKHLNESSCFTIGKKFAKALKIFRVILFIIMNLMKKAYEKMKKAYKKAEKAYEKEKKTKKSRESQGF